MNRTGYINRTLDFDNDGISDAYDNDDDNDGIPDHEDTDDDNDGILDIYEYDLYMNRTGNMNRPLDIDDDGDGISDKYDMDDDNDGIPDTEDRESDNEVDNDWGDDF